MEATYYKDTIRSYMIIECPPEAETTGYQYRMLEMNRIEGLLSCGTRHIDGERFLYYDITGKQSLMALYEARKIPGTELFKFLKAVDQVSGSMSKYLLDEQHLVLDEEQVFYDFQTGSYCFTYYPGEITEPQVFRFLADGIDGTNAEITGATASITGTVGTPAVSVIMGGTSQARTFNFAFSNLKGEQGIQGIQGVPGQNGQDGQSADITEATATIDDNIGTPNVSVTLGGTSLARTLAFAFTNLKGQKGDTGDTGQTGQTGNGIASIVKTSSSGLVDTYTITFTDNTTSTFTITNGEDGSDGAAGDDGTSVTGVALQSTVGKVKTYRMSFSDNTYFDYDVTDGADGGYTLPIASSNILGGIKVGNNLSIDANGVLSATDGGAVDSVNGYTGTVVLTASDVGAVDLTSAQDISGKKTFLGEKAIYFKQLATSNKLGFTLYNPSNTELGALEYRPNTISGSSLLNLNCPQTTGGYVGFRYWGTPAVNIVAPKVATAGNYFIPTHITDGNTTVTASNTGTVNISTLLPDVSNFVTNTSLATTLQDYVLSSDLSTTLTNYVTSSSLTTVLNDYQPLLESGTNIKTINNQSLLGSGNITIEGGTEEVFIAEYGTTQIDDITDALNVGKMVYCRYTVYENNGSIVIPVYFQLVKGYLDILGQTVEFEFSYTLDDKIYSTKISNTINTNNGWATITYNTIPTAISDLIDDTSTNPIDKADTLTGLTASVAELNYTDGVTSNIQTQLDDKVNSSDIWYDSTTSTLYIGVPQS